MPVRSRQSSPRPVGLWLFRVSSREDAKIEGDSLPSPHSRSVKVFTPKWMNIASSSRCHASCAALGRGRAAWNHAGDTGNDVAAPAFRLVSRKWRRVQDTAAILERFRRRVGLGLEDQAELRPESLSPVRSSGCSSSPSRGFYSGFPSRSCSFSRYPRLSVSLVPLRRITTYSPLNYGCSSFTRSMLTMRERWMRKKMSELRRASIAFMVSRSR